MGKMAGPDLIVIWANLIGSAFAMAVNIWSARKGWPDWSPIRWTVAIIAALYVTGYAALLAELVTLEVWSRFFRGVSPVAWVAVWAGPPLHAWRIEHRIRRSTVEANDALYMERQEAA